MDEQRAAEGVDHLQAAALEMIQAARAFLDVAEEVVTDRERVSEAFSVLTDVARAAARGATDRPGDGSTAPDGGGDGATESQVQRITLSS
jgi:hypothetical protein